MAAKQKKQSGALSDVYLRKMIEAGAIRGADIKNVRPASLDLSLSDEAYEVEGIFLPRIGESIRDVLKHFNVKKHPINKVMEVGKIYIIRLNEHLELPDSIYGFCNPKSTSGRNDIHVRVLADGVPRYDALYPGGWKGELWMSVIPKSFPIKAGKGHTLSQLRLFSGDTRFSALELELAFKKYNLVWRAREKVPFKYEELKIRDNDGSIILTLDLAGEVLGYEGLPSKTPLDLSKVGGNDPKKFFKPIKKDGGFITLKKNSFYILSTLEAVRIPPELASEMVPMDERSGDFRSHYAGFLDPGWGWGKDGDGCGRPFTLEVRPFEDVIVRHNQPIAKIKFEEMLEPPEKSYDGYNSNYIAQSGPKLSKHFKEWPKK